MKAELNEFADVEFSIVGAGVSAPYKTDENGKIYLEDKSVGQLTITETNLDKYGYFKELTRIYQGNVLDGQWHDAIIENEKQTGNLRIHKVNKSTQKRIRRILI